MAIKITSNQNSQYKEWKKLSLKKYRELTKLFIIEGVKVIEEGLNWGANFKAILYSDKLPTINGGKEMYENISKRDIELYKLDHSLIEELSDTKNPQGIIGIVQQAKYGINHILGKTKSFIIILENIQDPGNLGTIIRTADAAGIDGIILSKGCVDIYNSKVIRATMGSVFHLPIIQNADINLLINLFAEEDYQIIASDLNSDYFYHEVEYSKKKVLIVGNEAKGITKHTLAQCKTIVKIPIKGGAESLNAAVAAGILMYKMNGM